MAWGRTTASEQTCDDFRRLMTHDFFAIDPETGEVLEGEELDRVLAMTKPWRDQMWKAFRPIDDAMNPCRALLAGR